MLYGFSDRTDYLSRTTVSCVIDSSGLKHLMLNARCLQPLKKHRISLQTNSLTCHLTYSHTVLINRAEWAKTKQINVSQV